MLLQTFIRKQLRLKAHTVAAIEEDDTEMVVQIERLGSRRLRCSRCGRTCRRVHRCAAKQRSWRDLPLRKARLVLRCRWRRPLTPEADPEANPRLQQVHQFSPFRISGLCACFGSVPEALSS